MSEFLARETDNKQRYFQMSPRMKTKLIGGRMTEDVCEGEELL